MIHTNFYEPANKMKFWRNIQRRWTGYGHELGSFNAEQSVAARTNGELIYHVLDATVFIRRPSEKNMVGITADEGPLAKILAAKSLLEEITKTTLEDAI